MKIKEMSVEKLIPYANNPRHNDTAVDAVVASIRQFGFKQPIVVDKENVVIAGHTRLQAAKVIGMDTVPCVVADDLTPDEARAFRLADNKTGELAIWDAEKLAEELAELSDFDMNEFGFETTPADEINAIDINDPPKEKEQEREIMHCPKCGFVFEVSK